MSEKRNKGLHFINVIDELGRFVELKVYNDGMVCQENSHTYSYICGRKARQDIGQTMGLNQKYEPAPN